MLSFIFSALLMVSFILVIVTVVLGINGAKKNATFQDCNGTIINFYESSSEGTVGSYENVSISPVVEYTVNGTRYEFIGKYYSTNMKIGQDVTVLYNPDDPSVASIKSGTLFAPIVTGALAVVFLIPAIVYFIIKSKGIL